MARIGLVCGGGGDVAVAFMCGCLSAIHDETGWDPVNADYVVGTSAGSIMGCAIRVGIHPPDFLKIMTDAEVTPDSAQKLNDQVLGTKHDALPPLARDALTNARLTSPGLIMSTARNPLKTNPVVLAAAALPEGRLDNTFVRNKIQHLAGDEWPEGELLVTTTHMRTGRRTILSKYSRIRTEVSTAVAASCAIPSVFNPVIIDGEKYVDGGLASSTNADILLKHELDAVIILAPLSTDSRVNASIAGTVRTAMRVVTVAEQDRLKADGTTVLTFHPDKATIKAMGLNIMDVAKRPKVAELAYSWAKQLLSTAKAKPLVDMLSGP